jgi:hypothetical protein
MVFSIFQTRIVAYLIAIYISDAHSVVSDSLSIRYPLRLRGGSISDSTRSLPNPRLYQPQSLSDIPKISTDIIFVPEKGQKPEDIKGCKVIGSWSNWELQESLTLNVASRVWETKMLLSPGEYTVCNEHSTYCN